MNFYATLQVIRDKTVKLRYWKPAMMIGLGAVILDVTGLLTKSQPVSTGRAFTKIQKNG